MAYRQLTLEQRYQIHALRTTGKCNAEIARELGVHRSTIGREITRNRISASQPQYKPSFAQKLVQKRRRDAGKGRLRIVGELEKIIEQKLRLAWSPQQISGRLKHELAVSISHESIYRHLIRDMRNGGTLRYYLRLYRTRRRRYTGYKRFIYRAKRKFIELRPDAANERSEVGHWERDLVIGARGKAALLTITDRHSRFTIVRKVRAGSADEVGRTTFKALKKHSCHSITNDNGREFSDHNELEVKLKTNIYFCNPYSSWERGTVENMNGLIRQYFPKGTDFTSTSRDTLERLENSLNHRPRKTLDYLTPHEVFRRTKTSLFS